MKANKKDPSPKPSPKTETFGGPYHRFESVFQPKVERGAVAKDADRKGKKNGKRKRS